MLIVDDAREAYQAFARRPDAGNAHAGDAQLGADAVLRFRSGLTPERGGVTDLYRIVVDEQVDRFGRATLHDQQIVAGELELRSPVAARVGCGDGIGQRSFGHDHVAGAAGNRCAGQGTGGENEFIFGR